MTNRTANAFESPKRLIRRANSKHAEARRMLLSFFEDKPWADVREPNTDGTLITHKIKFTKEFPEELEHLVFEIAGSLRAALDQAGYAAAVVNGTANPKCAYFPIAADAAKLETDVIGRGRCKDLPVEVLDHFRSFQPYKAGNLALWAINEVANGGKHRFLAPFPAVLSNTRMQINIKRASHFEGLNPFWDRTRFC